MAIVRKSSNRSNVVSSSSDKRISVRSQSTTRVDAQSVTKSKTINTVPSRTEPKRLRELNDVNLGTLSESVDGYLVIYDRSTDKFNLLSPDNVLVDAASDNDLPDTFINVLDNELDLEFSEDFDGGGFV